MAIAFVQKALWATGTTVTQVDATLNGVGAGNLVVMNCVRAGSTTRSISTQDVTNTVNGTVAVAETDTSLNASASEVAIDYIPSAVGGNTTYRLSVSGGSGQVGFDVFEFSGGHASPLDATSTAENATGTSHVCAATGAIDTVADVAITTCIGFVSTTGGGSNPSGYTMTTVTGINARSGYKTSSGALPDENASQTTVSSRASVGCIASFKGAAAGGTVIPIFRHHYVQQGAA